MANAEVSTSSNNPLAGGLVVKSNERRNSSGCDSKDMPTRGDNNNNDNNEPKSDEEATSIDAELRRIHSRVELLLEGLRVAGDCKNRRSKVVDAIRSGQNLEAVLALATQLIKQVEEEHPKL